MEIQNTISAPNNKPTLQAFRIYFWRDWQAYPSRESYSDSIYHWDRFYSDAQAAYSDMTQLLAREFPATPSIILRIDSLESLPADELPLVVIGHTTIERQSNGGDYRAEYVDYHLRAKELAKVENAASLGKDWGYTLPATTPRATIAALRAPLLAIPFTAFGTAFERIEGEEVMKYQMEYQGSEIRLIYRNTSVVINGGKLTFNGNLYNVHVEFHLDSKNSSAVYQESLVMLDRVDDGVISDSARREGLKLFARLLALFLMDHPEAAEEARELKKQERITALEKGIHAHHEQISELTAELLTLKSGYHFDSVKTVDQLNWDHALLLDYVRGVLDIQDGYGRIITSAVVKALEPNVRALIARS